MFEALKALMPIKDYIAVFASLAALIVSIFSFLQKSGEGKLAIRKQLTEVLELLVGINLEKATYDSLSDKEGYPPNFGGLLADKRRFLVRQADYLSSQVSKLVSPHEYQLIAGSFDAIDDVEAAEYYFRLGSQSPKINALDKCVALRNYGQFHYSQGRIKDGKASFFNAIAAASGDTDRAIQYRGDTYDRWADREKDWGNKDEVIRLLGLAASEYNRIQHPRRRNYLAQRIEKRLKDEGTSVQSKR